MKTNIPDNVTKDELISLLNRRSIECDAAVELINRRPHFDKTLNDLLMLAVQALRAMIGMCRAGLDERHAMSTFVAELVMNTLDARYQEFLLARDAIIEEFRIIDTTGHVGYAFNRLEDDRDKTYVLSTYAYARHSWAQAAHTAVCRNRPPRTDEDYIVERPSELFEIKINDVTYDALRSAGDAGREMRLTPEGATIY